MLNKDCPKYSDCIRTSGMCECYLKNESSRSLGGYNAIPTDWMKEFHALMPEGCAVTEETKDWLREQYLNGTSPMGAYKQCKVTAL